MKRIYILLFSSLFTFISCSEDAPNIINEDNSPNVIDNQQATGTSANDLLSDNTFVSMVVEVVYVEGYEPTASAVSNFVSFLEERTFKPSGISVETRAIPSPGSGPYSIQEIVDIEDANRTKYNTSDRIAVWAFFADSEAATNTGNSVVLGTAYRNTSFVIYEATIHDLSNSAFEPNRTVLETTVITHEFGHILGLTNLGTDLQSDHEDTDHPKHCDVESCLMYWATEAGTGLDNLIGGGVPELDAQCIADLQANGGQ